MTEKFTDHLRLEMKKFGVNVSVIEPGNFSHCTSIENENMVVCIFILQVDIVVFNKW